MITQVGQVVLKSLWKAGAALGQRPLCLDEVGFREFSQFEEDGLLLYLFALVGEGQRSVVEISAGDGRECMATNLIVNHGWRGWLFDGSAALVASGREFFAKHADTWIHPPIFECAWITAENIGRFLQATGVPQSPDLLSLDVDGMDYWLWQALDTVSPRVVIVETQNCIPSDLALTAPYSADFSYLQLPSAIQDFRGASLLAMVKLGREKGYRLVGAHRYGFNCLFLRNDIGADLFPEVSVADCHRNPYTELAQRERWPPVKDCEWVKV